VSRPAFLKVSRFSRRSRRDFFFSVKIFKFETVGSRFGCVKIFIEIVQINQDSQYFQDLSRLLEIYQNILTLLRIFEGLQAKKLRQMEKS
jgi:hypothetical protein